MRNDRLSSGSATLRRSVACAVAAVVLVALAGCTSVAKAVSERTVPALWASSSSADAGIELATVTVADDGIPGFTVDLATVQAQGAGSAWRAASAQAAVTATFFSLKAPAELSVSFNVTGPIDGPSAGGILTVGVLAAMRGDSLKPGVTMTGTISPDGRIGMVGAIGRKIVAAKEAGYQQVLIPTGGLAGVTDVPPGIIVTEVQNLGEAYQIMTGGHLFPSASTASITPAIHVEGSQQAAALAGSSNMALARNERVDRAVREAATSTATASDLLARGAAARVESQQLVAQETTTAAVGNKSASQLSAMAAALAPALRAGARAEAAGQWAAAHPDNIAGIAQVAQIIAVSELTIRSFTPALLAVALVPVSGQKIAVATDVEAFDGFTNFLAPAATANRNYIDDVLPLSARALEEDPAFAALTRAVDTLQTPPIQKASSDLSEALRSNIATLAEWATSAEGLAQLEGRGVLENPEPIASELIATLAGRAGTAGHDASWSQWVATWANDDFESAIMTACAVASGDLLASSLE